MNSHRASVVVLVALASVMTITPLRSQVPAADVIESRSYVVPGHDTLRLQVPTSWTQRNVASAESGSVSVELIPLDEKDHLILLTALVTPDVPNLVTDPAALQDTVTKAARKVAARAVEGSLRMIRFETDSGFGYQFSATDKAPEPGEYRYVWQGSVVLGEDLLLGFTILSNDAESPHVQDAFRVIKQAAYEATPRSTESGIRVEEGRLLDVVAGYSFFIPPDWQLRRASATGWVVIDHEETGARFKVKVEDEADDLDLLVRAMKLMLPFVGGKWSLAHDGWTKIDGRRAGEIVSTRTYPGSEPLNLHSLVVVYKRRAYYIESAVPESHAGDAAADFAAILDSFALLKKK